MHTGRTGRGAHSRAAHKSDKCTSEQRDDFALPRRRVSFCLKLESSASSLFHLPGKLRSDATQRAARWQAEASQLHQPTRVLSCTFAPVN